MWCTVIISVPRKKPKQENKYETKTIKQKYSLFGNNFVVFIFETGSSCVAEAAPEGHRVLLPLSFLCWD